MFRFLTAVALGLVAGLAACASPAPCTQALCPLSGGGSYRVGGWTGSVTVTPDAPPIPIVSDSTVEVLNGKVEFRNRDAIVRASEGSSFRFEVSTATPRRPEITVSTGSVSLEISSTTAPWTLLPGVMYYLPTSD